MITAASVDTDALAGWLAAQRWFAAKSRELRGVRTLETLVLRQDVERELVLALVEARFADGEPERYQILLGASHGASVDGGLAFDDALGDPAQGGVLAGLLDGGHTLTGAHGDVRFHRTAGAPPLGAHPAVRPMGVEQSNSSVVLDERYVLKVFRRLEDGVSPELEMLRFLTAQGFDSIARLQGYYAYAGQSAEVTLGVLQDFVGDATDGWALALAAIAAGDDGVIDRLGVLGAVVGRMHTALGRAAAEDPDFAPAPLREADLVALLSTLDARIAEVWPALPEDDDALAAVRGRGDELRALLPALGRAGAGGRRIRHHGDLHLGQTLARPDGRWVVLDFEGEPARSLQDRRLRQSPLRDVAGMLRSFAYAASASALLHGTPAPEDWEQRARTAFLDGYLADADPALLPEGRPAIDALLSLFELEKAVYELRYEIDNRPDWVAIPAAGIARLLQEPAMSPTPPAADPALQGVVDGTLADPHSVLGAHPAPGGVTIRAFRPDAVSVTARASQGSGPVDARLEQVHPGGVFAGTLKGATLPLDYTLEVTYGDGQAFTLKDPYAFAPTLGELDIHLAGEGRHEEIYAHLGAHVREIDGTSGTAFSVWAPSAASVAVVGDFNSWDGRLHHMRSLGSSGIWELFVPEVADGARYKFEIRAQSGALVLKADPYAFATEHPPLTSSVVHTPGHAWADDEWLAARRAVGKPPLDRPISVYEVHLGSWRRSPENPDEPLDYATLARDLAAYVKDMGFTHVELLPVMGHPYAPSWGYQVTSYFAPSPRYGTPDQFRAFVDHLHGEGIGVLLDWVPAHFPKDAWALAKFDGTALYEHADPRRGEHPDWGTLVFNSGRNEVRNFLLASALFWAREYHADGIRVDAVASMLYLDYSREEGQWVPNEHGGNEDLEAVALMKELNEVLHAREPGVISAAEESTSWPGVSRPTYLGGLGFGFKWNMGWMNDTLRYFAQDPVHRKYHHHELTFSLVYAFTENFMLPLSHDEVVHGKGSMVEKMPGDQWQKLANLRALYAYMWAHPGKKLLFQGLEWGQQAEWKSEQSLDWHELSDPGHAGVQAAVRTLNHVYADTPALWEVDFDGVGFAWLEPNDADGNVVVFARFGKDPARDVLVCAMNLSPTPRPGYRVGLPQGGAWRKALDTDARAYGGSGAAEGQTGVEAEAVPWHSQPHSAPVDLPPLGVVWLVPER